MNLMYIYPDFLMGFRCIGSECLNTCCKGWDIRLDEDTAEYYDQLEGAFGDFLRQHVIRDEKTNKITAIRLEEGKICPFLNEEGLCRIQIELGFEHLGGICQNYPRYEHGSEHILLLVVVTSCDAVLDILYNRMQPVCLCTAGEKESNISTANDYKALELSHFISWGMGLLQDEAVPFGVALTTVFHVGLEAEEPFEQHDFEAVDRSMLQAPEIQAQFMMAKQELDEEQAGRAAWRFILGVVETFCQIIPQEMKVYKLETILWRQEMVNQSNEERKKFLLSSLTEMRKNRRHMSFMRRLAAVCFLYYESGFPASRYISNFCIEMILAEILPLTWVDAKEVSEHEYLTRLGLLSRWFQQTNFLADHLQKALDDLYSPDIYTYAIALMELFDCP